MEKDQRRRRTDPTHPVYELRNALNRFSEAQLSYRWLVGQGILQHHDVELLAYDYAMANTHEQIRKAVDTMLDHHDHDRDHG